MSSFADLHTAAPRPRVAHRRGKLPWWRKIGRWVPVRTLHERHRERVREHLLALAPPDRYLRFGYPASDEAIERYVDSLDFTKDQVFGIFNRHLRLIATSHVVYMDEAGRCFAEFAVSVCSSARGRGYGSRLFAHAVVHARNRGVDQMLIHALTENVPMLQIAHRAGAKVQRDGSESDAWLKLPPDTLSTRVEQLVSDKAAELNYGVKFETCRWARIERRLADLARRWLGP